MLLLRFIRRDDNNDTYAVEQLVDAALRFLQLDEKQVEDVRRSASEMSKLALWDKFFHTLRARLCRGHGERRGTCTNRTVGDGGNHTEQINFVRQQLISNKPSWHRMMVEKRSPSRLHALETISRNLVVLDAGRDLFESVDPELWTKVERNPIALIYKLSIERINELEKDKEFLARLDAVSAHAGGLHVGGSRPVDAHGGGFLDGTVCTPSLKITRRSGYPCGRLPR